MLFPPSARLQLPTVLKRTSLDLCQASYRRENESAICRPHRPPHRQYGWQVLLNRRFALALRCFWAAEVSSCGDIARQDSGNDGSEARAGSPAFRLGLPALAALQHDINPSELATGQADARKSLGECAE
jgi:hypothetical protein